MTLDTKQIRSLAEAHDGKASAESSIDWRYHCPPTTVLALLDRLDAVEKETEDAASESIRAHAEYKQRRNAQFAAYEQAHRATIAYLLDRAENYSNSSGYRALFDELVEGFAERRHVQCAEAGEYDDLWPRVDRIVGRRREGKTEVERLQEQLATITAARDEACEIADAAMDRLARVDKEYRGDRARLAALRAVGKEGK